MEFQFKSEHYTVIVRDQNCLDNAIKKLEIMTGSQWLNMKQISKTEYQISNPIQLIEEDSEEDLIDES